MSPFIKGIIAVLIIVAIIIVVTLGVIYTDKLSYRTDEEGNRVATPFGEKAATVGLILLGLSVIVVIIGVSHWDDDIPSSFYS